MRGTLFYHGEIYSVCLDGTVQKADSVYIEDGFIQRVGGLNPDEWKEKAECVDLHGSALLPGFCDSHLHASSTAELMLDLPQYYLYEPEKDTRESLLGKYLEGVLQFAGEHPERSVIRGSGWDPGAFMELGGFPDCRDLDRVCADRPVLLNSYDHHHLWVNSKALEIAGITADTPTPRNGRIERDRNGNPTGIFAENTAIDALKAGIPGADYSVEEYKKGILCYQETYGLPYGTILIFDAMTSQAARTAYKELAAERKLHMRVRGCFYADPAKDMSQFDQMIAERGNYNFEDLFRVDTVKFFMDGSMLSFYLERPFEEKFLRSSGLPEDYRGYAQWNPEEIKEIFLKMHNAGFQIHVHCMGAGAVSQTLDALEYTQTHGVRRDARHVIAHVMNILPEDMERMANLHVIAAMQPMWAIYDELTPQSFQMLGKERTLESYPVGRLIRADVRLSCGTDFPVTIPPNPFIGIATGMTRRIGPERKGYELFFDRILGPEADPLTDTAALPEMVAGYTIGGAYQCFAENLTGSLEPGKSADFVILDGPLADASTDEIRSRHVIQVYLKGKRVH